MDGGFEVLLIVQTDFDFAVHDDESEYLYFLPLYMVDGGYGREETKGMGLGIGETFGLLLLPTKAKKGTYERCGVYRTNYDHYGEDDIESREANEARWEEFRDSMATRAEERAQMAKQKASNRKENTQKEVSSFVSFSVGPTKDDVQTEGDEEEKWTEYIDFEGGDYVLRVI